MDISSALSSVRNIRNKLKEFPKYERLPPIRDFRTVKQLNTIHADILAKCLHFFNKIQKEIKSYAAQFDEKYFENIKTRHNYFERELDKAKKETLENNQKRHIIKEIEMLEQNIIQAFDKIIFDTKTTQRIISYIHENNCAEDTRFKNLESFIELQLENGLEDKIDAYEKILNFL